MLMSELAELVRVGSKERHAQQIYWAMVDWLAKSDVRPGDRLPNENELADRFAVSRPTMREALRVLEYAGLVESRQGRSGGLFAGEGALPQVIGALRTMFIIGNRTIEDLYQARSIIEVGIARAAALTSTEPQRQVMAEAIEIMERNEEPGAVRHGNTLFHMTLAESIHNDILQAIMSALISLLNELTPNTTHYSPEQIKIRADGHRAILAALERQDPEGAAEAMSEHVQEMTASRRERRASSETA
jgi:GntR family transcriptional repressor for pyruvate dehydrogenase complex